MKKLLESPYQGSRQYPTKPTAVQRTTVGWRVREVLRARIGYCGSEETSVSHFCSRRLRSSLDPNFLKS